MLILTVTRQCNLRCSYCPTAKDGWPSLSTDDAREAVRLYAETYGGGDIKIFGGEPLLVPEVTRAAIEAAAARPEVRRIYLSTNGIGLNDEWLALLRATPQLILTISLDGRPDDHSTYRRALPGIEDSYEAIVRLLPALLKAPRVVVTQTIAPAGAKSAYVNFRHLRDLGFRRFNFLPGYYLPWSTGQLAVLSEAFAQIAADIKEAWTSGHYLYVRNLFTWAPTPFFNTGLIVDADRTLHSSNVGLAASLDELRTHTQIGTLDAPPTAQDIAENAARTNDRLRESLGAKIWMATEAVDLELTRFCNSLYPAYIKQRRTRRQVA